jgi:IPT/TIG domain
MRTQGCRWRVVVLLVVPALFLLQACGGASNSDTKPAGTALAIASISPTSVTAGASGLTLTLLGTGFLSGAAVCWNGSALATTYVSATQLAATVPPDRLAAGASVTITVVNPGSDGGTSGGVSFAVNNPAPVVTGIAPTLVPAGSGGIQLIVDGSGFSSASQVRWNGTVLTTMYVSSNQLTASVPAANLVSVGSASVTVVNQSPGGGTSSALVLTVGAASSGPNHVTGLAMDVTALVWDASRSRIYAALPGTTTNGNSLVAIDPLTGATTAPVYVGSDPKLLALSSDASHLWVSLDGANAIQRVTLPNLTPDSRIDLPPSRYNARQIALAMQAAPANPDTVAVILGNYDFSSPDTGGVAIYDGAVQRSTTIAGSDPDMTWLQWGPDDRTLYGQNGADTSFDFYVMNVDASGVRMGTDYGYVFPNFFIQSHYDRATGRVYADDGRVFDPSTGTLAGAFNLRDFVLTYACIPDPVEPIVIFLGRDMSQFSSNSGVTLRAFDKNTYRQLGNLLIPDATGAPRNLIRWGRAGVAFNTIHEIAGEIPAVYIVDGWLINPSAAPDFTGGTEAELLPVFTSIAPESASVGSPDLVLTVSGSEFQPAATVYWQGQPLVTTYHSSTELQAVVPASKLAVAGSATVSVANHHPSYAVNSLAFTVLPASSGMVVRNLASLDIAWDPHSSRLYAPVWSVDPRYPNSVVAIDPVSGSISRVAGVAPDPAIVRISRDGTLGYTGHLIANLITQFHLPALDSVTTWRLGADASNGPYKAMDLQPAPDSAQTIAVALGTPDFHPANHGLAIFDDGIARPRWLAYKDTSNLYNSLQWGLTDSVLYAVDNETTGFELSTIGVDATGATLVRSAGGVLADFYLAIHFDRGTGYVYADDGYATDPTTGSHVGRYNASGLLVPDSSLNRVFILGQSPSQTSSSDYTILSFDQSHFTPVSSLTIRNLIGHPVAITRWGTSGLAIVTSGEARSWGPIAGMLYVLDNPTFVSATQPVQAGVENLTVGLTWQPRGGAVSSSGSIRRSTDGVGKVFRPYPKPGTRAPIGRQEGSLKLP